MADKDTLSFRAKKYSNRKEEQRVQVSGLQADFVKLAKGDDKASSAFNKALVDELKSKEA